ncbi:MAG: LuxR family transcriptional regulator [Flavobacterium sp.]|nr:LuxR family transcriptional regulator [Flavobacterium sp.]
MNSLKKIIFILFIINKIFCQELPPIVKYSPATYGAGNQNWMISQDRNHYVYFANNDGLLQFNGSNWTLYPSPNETIIRSVKVIDNKVFTGCYMEFGFWTSQKNGQLKYTSLSRTIKNKIQDDEQFWNIINYDQWVVFQSLSRMYIYDTKTNKFNVIAPKNGILKSFRTNNSIYFQTISEGLFEIENGTTKLVSDNIILKNNRIINIFSSSDALIIQTQNNGLFFLKDSNLSKYNIDSTINFSSIYSSQMLSDGSLAIGTVSNGIFIVSSSGTIKYHITQNRGLSNNTILSLFEDADKNLWIGLDNGINCINLQSPVRSFSDDTGFFGTVYASILHDSKLYIGTNQGLFYKDYQSNNNFQFIAGTKGQVWSLFEYQNTLFCGHDSGTFIVQNATARNIFANSGTWKFNKVPNNPNLILQGNYFGLSVLEKINNQWIYRNKISNFGYSSKFFEIDNSLEVYISHEYKGIFNLQLDPELKKVINFKVLSAPKKGKNASLAKFNSNIFYAYKDGIFKLNKTTKVFENNKLLSNAFLNDEYTSGKLVVDKSNKLWLFTKNYIHYFTMSKLGNELKQNIIPIPSSLTNSMLGYENITQLSESVYLIGTADGYYSININDLSFKNYNVAITNVGFNKQNENVLNYADLNKDSFDYDQNNITISCSVPEFNKYINAEYKYLLEGFQDDWSDWSAKSTMNFKNLSPGNYVFKVKSKIANSGTENIAIYSFTISKPWYKTNLILIIYFIMFVILVYKINQTYQTYYRNQREKLIEENNLLLEIKGLENEQEIMKVRNEQLSSDFDAKNRELAVSTISLIKKNELLSLIKDDLKKTSEEGSKSIKSVISTINKNIVEEDTWNIFKEAFDSADKDFLKKVKLAHPSLTPNDLRLCAYLRLNLSSKEVAPLINISVRSVEIKRYRLRKKMELTHEQGLVEYILSI